MALKKGYKELLEEARSQIVTLSLAEAKAHYDNSDVTFVDIRDIRELQREGTVPDAVHAPRGMLEFWVDPESPYYREVFGEDTLFILYCQSAWRSSLAALSLQKMGLNVAHVDGGFKAWKQAGLPVAAV